MKKINKYIKYVAALALLPVVTACFTGIENTGRITDRDVARVKANKRTAEEALLDSVKPQTYGQWRKGKRFVVHQPTPLKAILLHSQDRNCNATSTI